MPHIQKHAQYWKRRETRRKRERWRNRAFVRTQRLLSITVFTEVYHPELASLNGLDDEEQDKAAFELFERHLSEFVEKLVEEGVFTFENRRKWLGL